MHLRRGLPCRVFGEADAPACRSWAPAAALSAPVVSNADVAKLEAKLDRLVSAQTPAQPDTTAAALGESHLSVLQNIAGGVAVFAGSDGAPILTAAQQREFAACTTESDVVKFITPFLWELSDTDADDACGAVLVNSERFRWLDQPKQPLRSDLRLKPDLFRTWRAFIVDRGGTATQGVGPEYLFGPLAHRNLQLDGCVRELYEAKLDELSAAHFGELVTYHRLIRGLCCGMLFNRSTFWLYASHDGHPTRLLKCSWTAPGTAQCVRDFFAPCRPEPPLLSCFRELLRQLDVCPVAAEGTAFLGAGGYGRVFRVTRVPGTAAADAAAESPLALKVMLTSPHSDVCNEYNALLAAAERGAPVVPVVANSVHLLDGDKGGGHWGGGFLLREVGSPFEVKSRANCRAAFASLRELHACGVLHGDARLPNLLRLRTGTLAWIDLQRGVVSGEFGAAVLAGNARYDARRLACSILGCETGAEPDAVEQALRAYDGASAKFAVALADAVWAAKSPR